MKIRTLKKFVVARMMFQNRFAVQYFRPSIGTFSFAEQTWVGHKDPVIIALVNELMPEPTSFELRKVSNDEVVATVETKQAALDMVLKYARQKKAKLYAVDSNGDPVLFSEEEAVI